MVATTPAYPSIPWGWWGRSPVKHSSLVLFLLFSLFFNYFKYIYLNII
nr:MAG TPA: hypothetical protein [Caudoviricetes sp.]